MRDSWGYGLIRTKLDTLKMCWTVLGHPFDTLLFGREATLAYTLQGCLKASRLAQSLEKGPLRKHQKKQSKSSERKFSMQEVANVIRSSPLNRVTRKTALQTSNLLGL